MRKMDLIFYASPLILLLVSANVHAETAITGRTGSDIGTISQSQQSGVAEPNKKGVIIPLIIQLLLGEPGGGNIEPPPPPPPPPL